MKMNKKLIGLSLFLVASVVSVFVASSQNAKYGNPTLLQYFNQQLAAFLAPRPVERIYLHTDKPFYEAGETIWLQAYLRNDSDLKPSQQSDIIVVELINPKGNVEKTIKLIAKNGTSGGDFALDPNAAGGLYKLKAYTNFQQNDVQGFVFEKEIQVQKVVLPRLKMKLDFQRDAYQVGEKVSADLDLQSLANQPLSNYEFRFVVRLKGDKFKEEKAQTDANGKATIEFLLPQNLNTADGLLNVLLDYQGQTESISRSVPIILENLSVQLFPEGGDLVVGLPTRLAFAIFNEFGKPADSKGSIIDENNKTVAVFESFHKGMGAVNFTPQANKTYAVKLQNSDKTTPLPEILPIGFGLSIDKKDKDKLKLNLTSSLKDSASIVAQVRGKAYFAQKIGLVAGVNVVEINTEHFPAGVAQITLFDSKNIERAERLVFLNAHKTMKLSIETDKEKYLPREKVKVTLKTTDERGLPIPANISLAVVNDKLLAFADDKSSNILSTLLLETDLKSKVEEPKFYFDDKEPKATQALDYLLMTQGWRKFTWKQVFENQTFNLAFPAEKAVIGGTVFDGRQKPMPNAIVEIAALQLRTTSNADGKYRFNNVPLYEPLQITSKDAKNNPLGQQMAYQYGENYDIADFRNIEMLGMMGAGGDRGAGENAAVLDMEKKEVLREMAQEERPKKEQEKGRLQPPPTPAPVMPNEIMVEKPIVDNDKNILKAEPEEKKVDIQDKKDAGKRKEAADNKPVASGKAALAAPKIADRRLRANEVAKRDQAPMDDLIAGEIAVEMPNYYRARVFPKVEYALPQQSANRTDFRNTVFWEGNIETDRTGKKVIEFYNNDDITAFRITAEGVGIEGSVGRVEKTYFTQLPFGMDIKVPLSMSMGDNLAIPLNLTNNTDKALNGTLTLKIPQGWQPEKTLPTNISLEPKQSKTVFLNFNVLDKTGKDVFEAVFNGGGLQDAFQQTIDIQPKGFPAEASFSGQEIEKTVTVEIKNLVAGSITAQVTAFPTALGEMMSGLESILRQPYGCFEQTSSSTYPNILVLNYLQEYEYKNPTVLANAKNLIETGYSRLTSFETKEKGYEWFGGVPAHEALTAYGLMEFKDMQKTHNIVDAKMVNRTAEWLLARRDGKGGFMRSAQALDQFGRANDEVTNAYIFWALTEAGTGDLTKEADLVYQKAIASKDAYCLALVANGLMNLKDQNRAAKALEALLELQDKNGGWQGKTHSVTYSTGEGLQIETTSLTLLALLKAPVKNAKAINDGVKFLMQNRNGYGGFGNTQSTILALKALVDYAKYSRKTAENGTIEVFIGNKKVATQNYEAGRQEAIVINGLEKYLSEGKNDIKIQYVGAKNPLPYTLAVNWSTHLPNSDAECKVSLSTKLAQKQIKTGETVRLTTELRNTTKDGLPMTLAIVGIAGGLSPQAWQLKELQEKKIVDFYEVVGNNVIFYYRQLKPEETKTIHLDLKAEVAGNYEAAASSAFLYYTNEFKHWTKAEKIKIN